MVQKEKRSKPPVASLIQKHVDMIEYPLKGLFFVFTKQKSTYVPTENKAKKLMMKQKGFFSIYEVFISACAYRKCDNFR